MQHVQYFYAAAEAFGEFRYLLSEYPADTLHETIPDFHNTKKRYERFLEVLEKDAVGRAREVQEEIAFVKERASEMGILLEALRAGDETNLGLVQLNLALFECYVRGYSKGCKGTLTDKEYELLPMGRSS